jgi:hypothetical protein
MDFFTEYGLLVAVAAPVAVVVALQVYLFVTGERGTLLLPCPRPYEPVAIGPASEAVAETELARTTFEADGEIEEHPERLAA